MATSKQFNAEQGISVGGGDQVIDPSGNLTTQTITGRNLNSNVTITPLGTGTVSVPSINKVTLTPPATGATLTVADGKTITFNETFTLTATAGATIDFGTGGTIAFEGGGFIYDNVAALSNLSSVSTITTGVWEATDVGLAHGGTGASLADPDADRILFWDDSLSTSAWLATGNSITISGVTIDTVQDIRTSASPTFSGLTVNGNLTVTGTSTIINSTTVSVDDSNITLGDVVTPTNATANGGGITLKGATDKTIVWDSTNTNWTSSEHWNLAAGKQYKINNVQISAADLSNGTSGSGAVALVSSPSFTTPTLGVATATSINKVTITAPVTSATLTIANGKTLTANNTLTFTGADASSVAFGTGGTVAYTADKLSAFAATTSAELAGVITNETGSGSLVFATSPTLVTPVLGVATATSINKVAITAPATSATLTIANGKTLTVSNTLTFTGTDASSVAFSGGGTVTYTTDKLSVFASTTSTELRGVISDSTGTGALAFATSPTLVTPNIGSATGTSLALSGVYSTGNTIISVASTLTNNTSSVIGLSIGPTITGGATTNTMFGVANSCVYNPSVAITTAYHSLNQIQINSGASYATIFNEYNRIDLLAGAVGGVITSYHGHMVGTPIFNGAATTDITNFFGYHIQNPVNGSGVVISNVYGIYADINTGTGNRWNVFANGSANNAFVGRVRIGSTIAPNEALDVTGDVSVSGTIHAAGGGGVDIAKWTASNTDIVSLVSGSTFGALFVGPATGHVTISLRDNDANDGFQIVSGNGAYVSTYTKLAFEVKGTGNTTVGGTLTTSGAITAPDLVSSATTFNLANTVATTVNFAGASTALTIGATSGTCTIRNTNVTLNGDLAVNGGDITTNQTTFNLINTTATTVNFAGAATTLNLATAATTMTIGSTGNAMYTLRGTGALTLPNGGTFSGTAVTGMIRYNTTDNRVEAYVGASPSWSPVGGATISNDTSTNATRYINFTSSTSGVATTLNVSSTKLTFNPSTGNFTAGGSVTAFSDARLKEDIVVIPDALAKLDAISGYTFRRTDLGSDVRQAGVLAQEVKAVLPEVVVEGEDGIMSVAYGNLVALLIQAVKELKAEVDTLKNNK